LTGRRFGLGFLNSRFTLTNIYDSGFRRPDNRFIPVGSDDLIEYLSGDTETFGDESSRVYDVTRWMVRILEQEVIRQMLRMGILMIALGGGGIPVVTKQDRSLIGVEAVIDKDRASAMLASALGADLFVISTDVDRVYLDYKGPNQRGLCRATAAEMRRYGREGHFPEGSMGPKVESALRFLADGGSEVIITSGEKLTEAVNGNSGTHIYRDT